MSNERPDEFFSWRSRLGKPDALPEQGLDDRELTWQKLAERLREPPRRRLTGYWIAAACLLLVLAPAARFFQLRQHPVTNRPQSVTSQQQPVTSRQQPVSDQRQPGCDRQPVLRSGPASEDLAGLRPANTRQPVYVHSPRIPETRTSTAGHQHITTPDSSLSSAAAPVHPITDSQEMISQLAGPIPEAEPKIPPKNLIRKQLRIVYLNELDNPAGPEPAMTITRYQEPLLRVVIPFKNH